MANQDVVGHVFSSATVHGVVAHPTVHFTAWARFTAACVQTLA